MHHLERNARFREHAAPAERVILNFALRLFSAIKPGGGLGVKDGHASDRLVVDQIAFVSSSPLVNISDRRKPATIMQCRGKLAPPWTRPVRNLFQNPNADLGILLYAVFPPVRFFEPHSKEADVRLRAERRTILLCGFADNPWCYGAVTRLTVGNEHRCAPAEFDSILRDQCAARIVGNHRGVGANTTDGQVPPVDAIVKTLLTPTKKRLTGVVSWIVRSRNVKACGAFEVFPAVSAEAITGAVPSIQKNAFGFIALHDFAMDRGHELKIVRTKRARNPHLRRCPMAARLAIHSAGNPVRMRSSCVVVRSVRIGAQQDTHPQLAAAFDHLANDVPFAQPCASMMKRNLRRIVGDASTGGEADAIGLRLTEIGKPEI